MEKAVVTVSATRIGPVVILLLAGFLVTCSSLGQLSPPGTAADWPGYGGHDDAHYSPLAQINAGNAHRLGLAWYYDIDVGGASNTEPVAVGGVLYFAAGYSVVHAIDASTGALLWKYDPEAWKVAGERMRASWGSRGLAVAKGRVFVATVDGRLVSLDARTGIPVWTAQTLEPNDGRYITGAPWVAGDKVIIGHGGADFSPVRGYVTAYDLATGKQAWRFHTVPGNPANGFESDAMAMAARTWTGEWWKWGGGGTVWNAMAYDPRRKLIYLGTGNGSPWNQKIRSPGGGDNLFLASIVALDAATGKYVWHYQVNPGETWDYNAAMDIALADLVIDGRRREVLLHAPKNGFFYVLDRATGELISAEKFARNVNWASRIDRQTGRPVENPEARYPNGQPALVYPSSEGAHTAEPMAFNPVSGLAYIDAIDQARVFVDPPGSLAEWRFQSGLRPNTGTGSAPPATTPVPMSNELLAWNPVTQQPAWRVALPGVRNGGLATTAGNLVLEGQVTGQFNAYAADQGKLLWSFDAMTGIIAAPISYMAGGRQYISVVVGWRGSGSSGLAREWDYTQQTWRVLTFVLDGGARLPQVERSERPIVDDAAMVVEPARSALGAGIYGSRCFLCHGRGATAAGMAPDLRKSHVPLSGEAFSQIVRDGALAQRGMPAFPELSADDLDALRHYVRQQARLALTVAAAGNQGFSSRP